MEYLNSWPVWCLAGGCLVGYVAINWIRPTETARLVYKMGYVIGYLYPELVEDNFETVVRDFANGVLEGEEELRLQRGKGDTRHESV